MKRLHFLLLLLGAVVFTAVAKPYRWPVFVPLVRKLRGHKTVAERLAQYGEAARSRLAPHFAAAGLEYPPGHVVFVGLKAENRLEVYAGPDKQSVVFVRAYPLTAASGELGPKLKYGDCQVPEGLYEIESLNPNSRYHLALRVNYSNDFDRRAGARDGREDLGKNIMIHGGAGSIGCLAVGDVAVEELFVLAAETDLENIDVILSPVDFRRRKLPDDMGAQPEWIDELYADIGRELAALPGRRRAGPRGRRDLVADGVQAGVVRGRVGGDCGGERQTRFVTPRRRSPSCRTRTIRRSSNAAILQPTSPGATACPPTSNASLPA